MRYERVKVKRDVNTVHNREVAPWEVPVLEFIFEDGNIEPLDEFVTVNRAYPTGESEMDRLIRVYGSDPQSGVAYANSVFGNARAGVKNLQKLIDEARANDEAAAKEPVPTPVPSRRSRRAAEADSLLG